MLLRLKKCRELFSLTQAEMAKMLDITEQSYQRYELGSRQLKIPTLIFLCDYFCVSLDYITGRVDDPQTEKFLPIAELEVLTDAPSHIKEMYFKDKADNPEFAHVYLRACEFLKKDFLEREKNNFKD